jgi:CRISPR/Cas system-associated endoribonuclease Cas2
VIIGALVYYLQRKDISTFEVRTKPQSSEQINQKLKQLEEMNESITIQKLNEENKILLNNY